MLELDEAKKRLELFHIVPAAETASATQAQEVLARLLAGGALSLGQMQIIRDLTERAPAAVAAGAAVFLAAMFLSLDGGNTYMRTGNGEALLRSGLALGAAEQADQGLADALPTIWEHAATAAAAIAVKLPSFPKQESEFCGQNALVRLGDDVWYFQRTLLNVMAVRQAVDARVKAAPVAPAAPTTEPRFAHFTSGGQRHELNAEQKNAVRAAASQPFTVITGGPGTGKTTVVCSLVAELLHANNDWTAADVALVAPTGRAAQRLGESLHAQAAAMDGLPPDIKDKLDGLNGSTIHRLLGGLAPQWKHWRDNPLPHKLVVVDETSMVDVGLMAALLDALPADARLVLLGDNDQLPAVGAGAVLGDFVAHLADKVVAELITSQRFNSEKDGSLGQYAAAVNQGDAATVLATKAAPPASGPRINMLFPPAAGDRELAWLPLPSPDGHGASRRQLETDVRDWARHCGWRDADQDAGGAPAGLLALSRAFPKDDPALAKGEMSDHARKLFHALNRARLLCVVREGPCGAVTLNRFIAFIAHDRFGRRNPLEHRGVPVIVTRNTPARNLFNGDVGVTVASANGMVALFDRGDQVIVCPVGLLPEHELAYAITVHKSQGSEFDHVLVVLPDNADNPLLNRQLLYTGITRARKSAGILGTKDALEKALATKAERRTGVVAPDANAAAPGKAKN